MGYGQDDFLLLVVGELLPNKNQIQVIKAIEKIVENDSSVHLLIAGNGKERANLGNYVRGHNLENNIHFLGYCTCLEKYQSIADLGVSCSIREGLGLNVIESMMSGNAFIATKNRGHNELIINGKNGFLVELGDVEDLANKIVAIINDENLRQRLSMNAKLLIKPYTLEETKKELSSIFETILI